MKFFQERPSLVFQMIISGQPDLVIGGGTCHRIKQQTLVGEAYFKNVYSRNSFRERGATHLLVEYHFADRHLTDRDVEICRSIECRSNTGLN
jgi:hypothetical protein